MPKSILDIKNSIDCHLGNRIVLKANGGRKKTIERSGVLKETYPSVFIVELDQDKHNLNAYLIHTLMCLQKMYKFHLKKIIIKKQLHTNKNIIYERRR